jgi:toxin ParE1/3/4
MIYVRCLLSLRKVETCCRAGSTSARRRRGFGGTALARCSLVTSASGQHGVTHIVLFTPEPLNQCEELESHIASEGAPIVAARYRFHRGRLRELADLPAPRHVARRYSAGLADAWISPPRDDRVRCGAGYVVNIIGIFYCDQDYEAALRDDEAQAASETRLKSKPIRRA